MSTVCGTCAYIAPEVLSHEGYDGRSADVWSCGVIAFVLCSGFLPFDDRDDDHKKLFEKIQNAQITYPPRLIPEQVDILSHHLERDPRRRWTAAQVLKHPWLCPKEPQTDDKFEKFVDPTSGDVIFSGKSAHVSSKVIEDTRLALLRIGWDARAYATASATVLRATRLSSSGTLGLSVDVDVPAHRSVSEGVSEGVSEREFGTRIVVHRRLGDFTKDRIMFAQLVDSLAEVLA
jgi:serine/threonine protein kinase